jgi:ribonuclease T2
VFGRVAIGAAVVVALAAFSAPVQAQSFWDDLLRGPSAPRPSSPPCVLDKCLNPAEPGPAPASPAAEPAPQGAAAGAVAPGNFDFYLLALSWSPGFCDRGGAAKAPEQCAPGANLGFVVHGLWPQFQHGYPSDCDVSRPVSRLALQLSDGLFPSESLARYEWRKHGTCTGLSPEAFFASVKRARDAIVVPDAFKAPRRQQAFAPNEVQRAFSAVNPGLRPEAMAIACAGGVLQEVRLCLSKDLRQFVGCPEVSRATCRSSSIVVAPVL